MAYPDDLSNLPANRTDWTGAPADAPATARVTAAAANAVETAINQIEDTLGLTPQGAAASVAARLAALDSTVAGKLATSGTAADAAAVGGVTVTGTPAAGQVLKATSTTAATWQADATGGGGGGAVTSVVGATGDVVGSQIVADAAVAAALAAKLGTGAGAVGTSNLADGAVTAAKVGADVATQSELDAVAAAKANTAHVHSATDVTSGTLPLARGGTGGTDAATARTSLGLGSAATMTPATIAADPAVSATYGRLAPDWITARAYVVGELVVSSGALYRCTTAHTSGGSINLGNFAALGGSGGAGLPSSFVTRTANATATAGQWILADATSGGFTVTLPTSPATGALVAVTKTDATSNVVTVLPGAGTIDGDTTATIVTEDAGAIFSWDGTAWRTASVFRSSGGATGLLPANNLSDLASPATARTNLGLGALATLNSVPAAVIGGGKSGDLYVWKTSLGSTTPNVTMTSGREMAIPFVLPAGRSVAAVSIHVSTLAASSVCRIGWRLDDDGWPGALQADLGTVATDTIGNKDLSVPFAPAPLTLWWLTITGQGGGPILKAGERFPLGDMLEGNVLSSDAKTAGLRGTPIQDAVSGALPSTFGARATPTTTGTARPPFAILTLA